MKSQHPQEKHSQPPFPEQEQPTPGEEKKLDPQADHGEQSYKGASKLKGLKAVITGGDSGIGRAVAIAFAREGADVLISYLNEHEDAEVTAGFIKKAGQKSVLLDGDIQDEKHCQKIIDRAVKEFGQLDILVNNAAFQMPHDKLEDFTTEQFEKVYRTNVFSMFYLCKAAVPHLKEGASIINTASIQAYKPSPNLLDYASSKSAIVGFTKALAQLLLPQGIRVNAVAPGPVWTPLINSTFPPDKTSNFGKKYPIERPAQPAELAPIYVLLASPEASYITAEVYGITGGKSPY